MVDNESEHKPKLSIPQMLNKLDEMYSKEEALKKEILRLTSIFEELQEEKELLQTMIMFQSNKEARRTSLKKKT